MMAVGRLVRSFSSFRDVEALPIAEALRSSLRALGVARLTRVQSEAFGPITSGQSCVAIARTGEGKTVAYLAPVLARLANERLISAGTTSCIIAVPTRELCQQVAGVLVALNAGVNVLLAYGKPDKAFNVLLRQNPEIIVGTSGRLASLAKKGELDLGRIKIAVFDEIDSLLNDDYRREVTPLMDELRAQTQVVAVGATMSDPLRALLSKYTWYGTATQIDTVASRERTPGKIQHSTIKVSESLRVSVVGALIAARRFRKAMIFVSSATEAETVARHPTLLNRAKVLHGDLPQTERERVLNLFRGGVFDVLVCTDVAARGIDVAGVDLVVSLKPPAEGVAYIHRAGRTGRAGSRGESVVLATASERSELDRLSTATGCTFESLPCPSREEQQRTALAAVVEQAVEAGRKKIGTKLDGFLSSLSESDKSLLAATCLKVLAGVDMEPAKISILSGEPGYSPVLFVDPNEAVIRSRADLEAAIGDLEIGLVAKSESGFVVDLKTPDALSLCSGDLRERLGVDVVLLDKLPQLKAEPRGRKSRGIMPWRRKDTRFH